MRYGRDIRVRISEQLRVAGVCCLARPREEAVHSEDEEDGRVGHGLGACGC